MAIIDLPFALGSEYCAPVLITVYCIVRYTMKGKGEAEKEKKSGVQGYKRRG